MNQRQEVQSILDSLETETDLPTEEVEQEPPPETAEVEEPLEEGAEEAPAETPAVEGEEGAIPSTIAEFAEYLEVDPAFVYGLEVPLGDGTSVSIGELKDKLKGVDKGEQERLQTQREQLILEQQRAQLVSQAQAQFAEHQRALDAELMSIEQVRQDPQLKALEQSDPGKAALVAQKLDQRAQAAHARQRELDQAVQQQGQHLIQEKVAAATQQILHNNPGWKDPDTFARESEPLYKAGERLGYSMAELDYMARTDPRIFEALKLVRRALELDTVDLKKVRKAAHSLPAGRQKATTAVKDRAAQEAWKQAGKATSMRDKAKILGSLIQ